MTKVLAQAARRRTRVRAKISGSAERPRLSVKITNKNITAQLINDEAGVTLAYVTTVHGKLKGNLTEQAQEMGVAIATQAKANKIAKVVFDRGSKIYHGRLDALATAARNEGLEL